MAIEAPFSLSPALRTGAIADWSSVLQMDSLAIADRYGETNRISCTWKDVQATIHEVAQMQYPAAFAEQLLHPDERIWHAIDLPGKPMLPLVFAGFPQDDESKKLEEALAVVVLDRRISSETNEVYLQEIRSAGVMTASNGEQKAVGVTHNAL